MGMVGGSIEDQSSTPGAGLIPSDLAAQRIAAAREAADILLADLTLGWPQRPGWRSSADLLHADSGTKVDLGAMPTEGVARCRAAWARLTEHQTCIVHGNPTNPGNVPMTASRVALIDWDDEYAVRRLAEVRAV